MRQNSGVTLLEMLTVLVALVVLAAVSVTLWHTHRLRVQRGDAIKALLAVQSAQDRQFAARAHYADDASLHAPPPGGLGIARLSKLGYYEIQVQRAADELGYVALARIAPVNGRSDARCTELRLDEHGRKSASSDAGEDSTADCWNRL